jgi:hypothetical protein
LGDHRAFAGGRKAVGRGGGPCALSSTRSLDVPLGLPVAHGSGQLCPALDGLPLVSDEGVFETISYHLSNPRSGADGL